MVMSLKSGKAVKLTILWSQLSGEWSTNMTEIRYKAYGFGILKHWPIMHDTMLWIDYCYIVDILQALIGIVLYSAYMVNHSNYPQSFVTERERGGEREREREGEREREREKEGERERRGRERDGDRAR